MLGIVSFWVHGSKDHDRKGDGDWFDRPLEFGSSFRGDDLERAEAYAEEKRADGYDVEISEKRTPASLLFRHFRRHPFDDYAIERGGAYGYRRVGRAVEVYRYDGVFEWSIVRTEGSIKAATAWINDRILLLEADSTTVLADVETGERYRRGK